MKPFPFMRFLICTFTLCGYYKTMTSGALCRVRICHIIYSAIMASHGTTFVSIIVISALYLLQHLDPHTSEVSVRHISFSQEGD